MLDYLSGTRVALTTVPTHVHTHVMYGTLELMWKMEGMQLSMETAGDNLPPNDHTDTLNVGPVQSAVQHIFVILAVYRVRICSKTGSIIKIGLVLGESCKFACSSRFTKESVLLNSILLPSANLVVCRKLHI